MCKVRLALIWIRLPITEEPSHTTQHTKVVRLVLIESAVGYITNFIGF